MRPWTYVLLGGGFAFAGFVVILFELSRLNWGVAVFLLGSELAGYGIGAAMHSTIAYRTAAEHMRMGVTASREAFLKEVRETVLPEERKKIVAEVRAALPPAPTMPTIPDYSARFGSIEANFRVLSDDLTHRVEMMGQDVRGQLSGIEPKLESFDAKTSTITARLDLTDQKLGAAIDAALKRELPQIEQRLAVLMGQQVQAGFARFQGQADRQVDEFTSQLADLTPRERLMMRMLKRNVGAKNAATVADLAALLKQQRGGPQQGSGQGGAPMGSIVPHPQSPTGWLQLTPQGWQPFQMPGQQPAYPGFGQAPAFPGGPPIPTPGAGAPPGYAPTPPALAPGASITPSGVAPPLPPPPKEVDRRAAEEAAEAEAEPAEPSSEAEPTPVPE